MTLPIHITTLLFDLDGTLIHHHPSSLDVLFTILDEHLVPIMATAHRETQQFMFSYWANSKELKQDNTAVHVQLLGKFERIETGQ